MTEVNLSDGGAGPAANDPDGDPPRQAIAVRLLFEEARRAGHEAAAAVLVARGFLEGSKGEWTGSLALSCEPLAIPARVLLLPAFPDVLPEVYVDRTKLGRRIAHVDEGGKVCIAPASGVLIDAGRPEVLVAEALQKAADEIARGLLGESDSEIQTEFLAYWTPPGEKSTYCTCDADGPSRTVVEVTLTGAGALGNASILLAESESVAHEWARRIGGRAIVRGPALFVSLADTFPPPDFGERTSYKALREIVRRHALPVDVGVFDSFLHAARLPVIILLSLPEADLGAGRRLVGVRIERPSGASARESEAGFQPGRAPTWIVLARSYAASVSRLRLERLDGKFLLARGGGQEKLAKKTVLLAGVGAVGSEIARHLASIGIGRLRLVDPELMAAGNVHRHALGIKHLSRAKAEALASDLGERFPHLEFEPRGSAVENLILNEPEFVTGVDLFVIAIGDEPVELRLNRVLRNGPGRIHTWVEPLGLGGHALGVTGTGPGCLECLYTLEPGVGLVNHAAFLAPGQTVQRSLAGCAGTFSPFSALNARRAAQEAAELAVMMLSEPSLGNVLMSWRGELTGSEGAGYQLSRRAAVVRPGERVRILGPKFARPSCSVCGEGGAE